MGMGPSVIIFARLLDLSTTNTTAPPRRPWMKWWLPKIDSLVFPIVATIARKGPPVYRASNNHALVAGCQPGRMG
jgi:hypothetical protein